MKQSKPFLADRSATYLLFTDGTVGKIKIGCTLCAGNSSKNGVLMTAAVADSGLQPFQQAVERATRWTADRLNSHFSCRYVSLTEAGGKSESQWASLHFFVQQEDNKTGGVNYHGGSGGLSFAIALMKGLLDFDPGTVASTGVITDPIDGTIGGVDGFSSKLSAVARLIEKGKLVKGDWFFFPVANLHEGQELQMRIKASGIKILAVSSLEEVCALLCGHKHLKNPALHSMKTAKCSRQWRDRFLFLILVLVLAGSWIVLKGNPATSISSVAAHTKKKEAGPSSVTPAKNIEKLSSNTANPHVIYSSVPLMAAAIANNIAQKLLNTKMVVLTTKSFRLLRDGILLPFSTTLYQELSAAFTREGIVVKAYSPSPVRRLVGDYAVRDDTITVSLRLVGDGAHAADLFAALTVQCAMQAEYRPWFKVDTMALAEGLVHKLTLRYHGANGLVLGKVSLMPVEGHRPLALGRIMAKDIRRAALQTPLFRGFYNDKSFQETVTLSGHYRLSGDDVAFDLTLADSSSQDLAHSSIRLQRQKLPQAFFEPATRPVATVCYQPSYDAGIPIDSPTIEILLGGIREKLAKNISIKKCGNPATNAYQIQVVGFSLVQGMVVSGYTTVLGHLRLQVLSPSDSIIAEPEYHLKDGFMHLPQEAYNRIAARIFSPAAGERLAAKIWEHGDE